MLPLPSNELDLEINFQTEILLIEEIESSNSVSNIFFNGIIKYILSLEKADLIPALRKKIIDDIKLFLTRKSTVEQNNFISLVQLYLQKNKEDSILSNFTLCNRQYKFTSCLFEELQVIFKSQIKSSIDLPEVQLSFITRLTEEQLKFLYKKLRKAGYIDHRTSEETFVMVFSGVSIDNLNEKTIIWVDKGKTRHEPHGATLYELIYLLKEFMLDETSWSNLFSSHVFKMDGTTNSLYQKLNACFSGVKYINTKNPDPHRCEPQKKDMPRFKRLLEIVTEMKNICKKKGDFE
jgi:hypothetical protein